MTTVPTSVANKHSESCFTAQFPWPPNLGYGWRPHDKHRNNEPTYVNIARLIVFGMCKIKD